MHDYVDQSMKNVENEISNLNKNVLNKEVESLEYNSKSFEQRLVTSLIVFAVMYIINLTFKPFLSNHKYFLTLSTELNLLKCFAR